MSQIFIRHYPIEREPLSFRDRHIQTYATVRDLERRHERVIMARAVGAWAATLSGCTLLLWGMQAALGAMQ